MGVEMQPYEVAMILGAIAGPAILGLRAFLMAKVADKPISLRPDIALATLGAASIVFGLIEEVARLGPQQIFQNFLALLPFK